MLLFLHLALSFLVLPSLALPISNLLPQIDPKKILCQLPIVKKILCPLRGTSALNRPTSSGTAYGVQDPSGAYRFPVKYASASRWAQSTVATTWEIPNGSNNVSAIPLACPQTGIDPTAYSEDCLSMLIYVPPTLTLASSASTLVWIHGGSFVIGSASSAGLDGSELAVATGSIVAVIQYRLGALGFVAPNGQTNLAVRDVMNALQFLKSHVPAFGGSPSKITIAGQSSGATMIRALLATPSASSLFRSAILQSDPMNYGFLRPGTQDLYVNYFNGLISCASTDTACLNGLSVGSILSASSNLQNNAETLALVAGKSSPIRPVLDGSLITTALEPGAFTSVSKPILITTVKDEAAFVVYQKTPSPLPSMYFSYALTAAFDQDRINTIVASPYYPPTPSDDVREQVELVGTDYMWRCAGYTFARNYKQNGGSVYVGQFNVGVSYPGNDAVPRCTEAGVVCHQDDIEVVFGTAEAPSTSQASLTTEMHKRYKAFLTNSNPNAPGLATWQQATTTDVHPLILGTNTEVAVGACDPNFWGVAVEYDYQALN